MKSQNPGPDAIAAIAKILLPDQERNNENIRFLKGRGLEYLAQHRSKLNSDLNFYAEEYIKLNKLSLLYVIFYCCNK